MNPIKKISVFLIAGLLFLASCGKQTASVEEKSAITTEKSFDIVIKSAWSRSAPELMSGTGIVYMTITNTGNSVETLLAGKTPAAQSIELHMHTVDANGVFRMRMVDGGRIEIAPGETVELKSGGLHIMLIDLTKALEAGDSFPLTLKFEHAGEVTFYVPVADYAPEQETVLELLSGGYEALK
jgi:periplasmic copper chaperone A